MKKTTIFLALGLLLFITDTFAQQDPQYTQYMYNMNVLNPAYTGSRGTLSLGFLGRTQWTNVDGAPKTGTFFVHAPIGRKVGVGLSVIADEIGPVKEQNIYADISYTLTTSTEGRLAFGLKGGVTLQSIDLLSIILPQDPNDALFADNTNETYPNFGAGVYYYTDNFYVGFSVPNILKSTNFKRSGGIITEASEEMHYFLTGGYVFDISDTFKLKPSLLLKGVTGAPVSMDINANVLMYDRLEVGLSYRFDDSISALINFAVTPDFRIGFAYDHTVSEFSNVNPGGSYEAILLYDIDFSKKNLKSPRFF
ncbi:MAG: type IX secretion system membrane protein PorP/SprF [Flavobacteriaceae bacterium]|nr:type IX secretion system membrane protein PorP/SprF [Flavobacteriaceae bacterium]